MSRGNVSSAQGGTILTHGKWMSLNEGYLYGKDCRENEHYKLSLEYLQEKDFCDESEFDHSLDCHYLTNHAHIELRGGHRFVRPSECSKFVLKRSKAVFNDPSWTYAYHGTHPNNMKSILKNGLVYPGYSGGVQVLVKKAAHGAAYGNGVYTSKVPLYAQLYATCEKWRNKYVQVMLMVRQRPESITVYGSEGTATVEMLDRDDLHLLYGGKISADEIQNVTPVVENNNLIQAILVKMHDTDPRGVGGEYHQVKDLLQQIYPK